MARTLAEDLAGTGLSGATAQLIADNIGTAGAPDWSDVQNKPASFPTTSTDISDATATGRSVLVAASQAAARTAIGAGTSSLAIGTTGTTAMAGNKVPTASDRGGVIQQTAIADIGAAPTQADFNGLLAKLRTAGILAP